MTDKRQVEMEKTEIYPHIQDISGFEPILDRKKLLEITGKLIDDIYQRVSGERFRPREGDKERLAYIRILREYIDLNASLLDAAGAPRFQGIPEPQKRSRPLSNEEIELKEAWDREIKNLKRSIVGLPPISGRECGKGMVDQG